MKVSSTIARNIKTRKTNSNKMLSMLNIAKTYISHNGGCVIDGVGVAYYNPITGTRDPIGCLVKVSDLKGLYGTIESDAQKPLVRKIASKFNMNLSRDCDRSNFVKFLQALQNAHDEIFDFFNNSVPKSNHISLFNKKCDQISFEYGLV